MNAQLWHDWTKTAEKNRFYKAKTKIWQKYVSRFRNTNAHIQACQKWWRGIRRHPWQQQVRSSRKNLEFAEINLKVKEDRGVFLPGSDVHQNQVHHSLMHWYLVSRHSWLRTRRPFMWKILLYVHPVYQRREEKFLHWAPEKILTFHIQAEPPSKYSEKHIFSVQNLFQPTHQKKFSNTFHLKRLPSMSPFVKILAPWTWQ